MADDGPLVVSWHGQNIHVRHDDPRLGPYSPAGSVIRCAVELANDARGLQLVLDATVGDRYTVRVAERPYGGAIGLRRLPNNAGRAPGIDGRLTLAGRRGKC